MIDADALIENAEAAKIRLEQAGLAFSDLAGALAAFHALPPDDRTPNRREYADLVVETAAAVRVLSAQPTAVSRSIRERIGFSITVTLCILLSIFSMIIVAQLSMVYRDGQAVLTDLTRLKASKAERRFSELQRQLVYAGQAAAGTAFGNGKPAKGIALQELVDTSHLPSSLPMPPVSELATLSEDPIADRMAIAQYYAVLFDLRELDRDIGSVMGRFQTFWQDSYQPISFVDGPKKIWNALRGVDASASSSTYAQSYQTALANQEKADDKTALDNSCTFFAKQIDNHTELARNSNWIKVLQESQSACQFSKDHLLSYNASGLPIFDTYIHGANYRLMPYSTWVMPMSFAVFGALLYYMRFLMNPLLPSPRLSRILHRVSLSALAGVVISLAWSNISTIEADFQAAGFTVFAICFLAGFSTDMFFSNLDRWVASADSASLGKPPTPDERQKMVESAHG